MLINTQRTKRSLSGPRAGLLTFLVSLLLVSVLYFLVVRGSGQPRLDGLSGDSTLTIARVAGPIPRDPGAAAWTGIEPVKVRLYPQTVRPPFGTEERDVWIRGMYDDREVAFLLEFADASEDRDATPGPDACAIMLVPDAARTARQMMGHGGRANVWHWLADRDAARYRAGDDSVRAVHSLLAAGPGTQSLMARQTVDGRGTYEGGKWGVLFGRPLASQQEGELELAPGHDLGISIAVWDGGRGERLSRKSIAITRALHLEPE